MGALLVLSGSAGAKPKSPVRRHIKEARLALLDIEKEIGPLVHKTQVMQQRLDSLGTTIKRSERIIDRLADKIEPHELALALLSPGFVDAFGLGKEVTRLEIAMTELGTARLEKKTFGPMLPKLRDHLWQLGIERKDRIEDLDVAIGQLEAVRDGDVPISAGVGGGKLITYSADWEAVSMCESTGRWHINTGLFDGGLQFLPSTWWMFGGGEYARYAYQATKKQQIEIAERVLAVQGPDAWPNCFKPLPVDVSE